MEQQITTTSTETSTPLTSIQFAVILVTFVIVRIRGNIRASALICVYRSYILTRYSFDYHNSTFYRVEWGGRVSLFTFPLHNHGQIGITQPPRVLLENFADPPPSLLGFSKGCARVRWSWGISESQSKQTVSRLW